MKFKEGQELSSIIFQDDSKAWVHDFSKIDCDSDIKNTLIFERIVISMENGQNGEVAWIECWRHGKLSHKYNAALIKGVVYL